MDLRLLELFCCVYEERSVSRAAKKLGLTQPTISTHLKEFEADVGTRLFDRVGRTIEPTQAGKFLYARAKPVPALKRRIVEEMAHFLDRVEGDLVVGASSIPGEYLLPTVVAEFQREHPAVRARVRVTDSAATVDDLSHGDIQLGVVGLVPDASRDLLYQPFARDVLVLAVPPRPPWPIPNPLSLDALKQLPLVVREPGSGTRTMLERSISKHGLSFAAFNVVAELDRTTSIKEMIRGGYAVSVVSQRAVASEVAAGTLRTVRVRQLGTIRRTFYTVVSRRRTLSPISRAFLAYLDARRDRSSRSRDARSSG